MGYSIAPYPPSPTIQVNGTPTTTTAINFGAGLTSTLSGGVLTVTAPARLAGRLVTLDGLASAGPIACSIAKVGDLVDAGTGGAADVTSSAGVYAAAGTFESVVSVAGQIRQLVGGISGRQYELILSTPV